MKTPAKLAILVCTAHFAYAHDQGTHLNITFQALNYLTQTDPKRPNFLSLYPLLADGSWNEDNAFAQNLILGRFFFHFLPALNSPLPIAVPNASVSATCDSNQWGLGGFSCAATYTLPPFPTYTIANQVDDHTWQLAIAAADPITKQPTAQGWEHLGYLIHLLEDLTSPPHTRNSAHPCVGWLTFCDPFEPDNNFASVSLPVTGHDYAGLSGATLDEFFLRLAQYTHDNYFSAFTVFNGDGTADYNNTNDGTYFYGTCLQATLDFNPGGCGPMGRKIARIGARYHFVGQTPAKGWVDDEIAHEQFAELGPVAVQAVADFIKFYAPAIVVSTDGFPGSSISSTPPSINCGAICSALFVNGTNVQLTAQVPNGYTVQWQGACSGTSATVTISNLTSDTTCKAVFQPGATSPVFVGSWDWIDTASDGSSYPGTMTISQAAVNGGLAWTWIGTGYSGTGTSTGSTLTLDGAQPQTDLTARWVGVLDSTGRRIDGTWTQSDGQVGTFTATR